MKTLRAWMAVPAIAGLLLAYTAPTFAAPGDTDRVTGGGWITPTYFDPTPDPTVPEDPVPPGGEPSIADSLPLPAAASNPKCTFGFVASRTETSDPNVWECDGELTFHDHALGFKLKVLSVEHLSFPVANTAAFDGMAEIRTSAGTATVQYFVEVVDAGEPGSADKFKIWLPAYTVPGQSQEYGAEGLLGGGNIQLHD